MSDPTQPKPFWSLPVRLGHWALVGLVAANQFFTESGERPHQLVGYGAVAIVIVRLVLACFGSGTERLSYHLAFWPKSGDRVRYFRDYLLGRELEVPGHPPLALLAMALMLFLVIALGFTGFALTLDAFFGAEWLEEMHEFLGQALLLVVGAHVLGVLRESWLHRVNLIRSMITGRR